MVILTTMIVIIIIIPYDYKCGTFVGKNYLKYGGRVERMMGMNIIKLYCIFIV
jgi:hypothetical protein